MRSLIFLALGGCLTGTGARVPRCASSDTCRPHDGERVAIIGIYAISESRADIPPERSKSRLVKIRYDGAENGPYLAAPSGQVHKRPVDEVARFRDKRVRVIGRYLREIPQRNDDSAQLSGACIEDIESITLAE